MSPVRTLPERVTGRARHLVGLDSEWVRPRPALSRSDVLIVVFFVALALIGLELTRGFTSPDELSGRWLQYLAVATYCVPLAWRRHFPELLGAYVGVHWLVFGNLTPEVQMTLSMQVAYFFGVWSALAWGRDRRATALGVGLTVLLIAGWLTWIYAVGSGAQEFYSETADSGARGPLPPLTSLILLTVVMNGVYFLAAIGLGIAAWWQAHDRALLTEQAETIEAQADELADQAVLRDRMRIARELHDVVAHHVSVMGVQAAAARRVMARDPDAAATALTHVEDSSRQAVAEMRGLVGTLRGGDQRHTDPTDRGPEPTVSDLPALVESAREPGFDLTLDVVEDTPGAVADLPLPVSLSLYRTVQEALSNVRRHSTANAATVVLRIARDGGGPRFAEVEVLDKGRPRAGSSGSGLGLLGMRERVALHGGTAEIGPRLSGGYRVRVRFPVAK